ncbi:MAG: hypothetical protein ACR2GZ_07400 [Solirubrobacteraceae bacterium]
MRRATLIGLIVGGVAVFLVVSALLTRALSVGGAENSAITDLVRAEAGGDRAGVVAAITGCRTDPACLARAAAVTTALRRSGGVQIIEINGSTGFAVGSTLATARVAWLAGASLPRVQCVRVRSTGNVLTGFSIQLLKVSVRIRSNADCPSRF